MTSHEYNILISIICVISVFYTVNAEIDSDKLKKCKDDLKNANFNHNFTTEEAVKHAFFNTRIPSDIFDARKSENFQYRYFTYIYNKLDNAIKFDEKSLYPYEWYIMQHHKIPNDRTEFIKYIKEHEILKIEILYVPNHNIQTDEEIENLPFERKYDLEHNFFALLLHAIENEESNDEFRLFMHHVWDNAIIPFSILKNPLEYCNSEEAYAEPVDQEWANQGHRVPIF